MPDINRKNEMKIDPLNLKEILENLPFAAGDLPKIEGGIKTKPEHFIVEEIMPYTPCGEGEHVYVTLKRAGWNTVDVARRIQNTMDINKHDMGWGGRKDKHAVAIQTFSIRYDVNTPLEKIARKLSTLPFEILDVKRHKNKIKTGHVKANRFTIIVDMPGQESLARARAIASDLKKSGIPNFYGPQRFGADFRNLLPACGLFSERCAGKSRKNPFMVSVFQSALFNIWLKERMDAGCFESILMGDIARKTDTGGLFIVDDMDRDTQRFSNREIIYTGPVFGFKMMQPDKDAEQIEARLMKRFGLTPESFRKFRAPGSRRPALLHLEDLEINEDDEGLMFRFTLPSGAYATTVMREFIR